MRRLVLKPITYRARTFRSVFIRLLTESSALLCTA